MSGGTYRQDNINDINEVRALGGSDLISIGNGIDIGYAGSGNDFFFLSNGSTINFLQPGGKGKDKIFGQGGSDTITHGDDNGRLDGGADDDIIFGGLGSDNILGQGGDDRLRGGLGEIPDAPVITPYAPIYQRTYEQYVAERQTRKDGGDKIFGGKGNDTIYGEGGNDILRGEKDNDVIYGGQDNDRIYGGDDRDTLFGGNNNDRLYGEDGQDILNGEKGNDELDGGDGNDALYGGIGKDTLTGGTGRDQLYGGENGDEFLIGSFTRKSNASKNKVVTYAEGGAGKDVFNVVTRLANSSDIGVATNQGNSFYKGNDDPHILVGGAGNDFFNFNTNKATSSKVYGGAQYSVIEDFEIGKDKITFEEGGPSNFVSRNVGNMTEIYVFGSASVPLGPLTAVLPGIDVDYKQLVVQIKGIRNLQPNDPDIFGYEQRS